MKLPWSDTPTSVSNDSDELKHYTTKADFNNLRGELAAHCSSINAHEQQIQGMIDTSISDHVKSVKDKAWSILRWIFGSLVVSLLLPYIAYYFLNIK